MNHKVSFEVLRIDGIDAQAFLHSQFAADLLALADGGHCWSALLNPQGRVLFVVAIFRVEATQWRLAVPFGRAVELVNHLKTFVFRRKVKIAIEPELKVNFRDEATGIDLEVQPIDESTNSTNELELDRWIGEGLALIDSAASARHLVHALRLDRFGAFSVQKGCYPGQEIVARTHFLGRNRRELVELSAEDPPSWTSGDPLYQLADSKEVGEIVCAGTSMALGVLHHPDSEIDELACGGARQPARVTRRYSPES